MTESNFPNTHTTGTTTASRMYLDKNYIKTFPAILKIVEMGVDLLGFIITVCTYYSHAHGGSWYNFVAMLGFWYTGIMLVLEMFHIPESVKVVPWIKVQFGFSAVIAFFFMLAATICAAHAQFEAALGGSAFFGYCAMVLYAFDTWRTYSVLRSSPQGGSNATSPNEQGA